MPASSLWIAAGIVGFLVVVAFVARGMSAPPRPRYVRQAALMSAAELAFFRVLAQVADANYLISMKVRVADIITPVGEANRKAWWAAFAKVSSKHVDFVLADPATAAVRLAIELDDRSHARADRRNRDEFLNRAFAEAGVPLLRIRARARGRAGYNPDDVRRDIAEVMNSAA